MAAGSTGISSAARNATLTSLLVCCALLVCWSPNQIAYLASLFGYPLDWSGWFYHFTVSLVFTNSCINPFIYAAKYREFQQGMRSLKSKVRSQVSASITWDETVWAASLANCHIGTQRTHRDHMDHTKPGRLITNIGLHFKSFGKMRRPRNANMCLGNLICPNFHESMHDFRNLQLFPRRAAMEWTTLTAVVCFKRMESSKFKIFFVTVGDMNVIQSWAKHHPR